MTDQIEWIQAKEDEWILLNKFVDHKTLLNYIT